MNPRIYSRFEYPVKFGTNSFLSLLFDVLRGGLVRATWNKRRREALKFRSRELGSFSPSFLIVSTQVLWIANSVSGKFAASKLNSLVKKWIPIMKSYSCPGVFNDVEVYALKLLKEGCIRDPLFSKPGKEYTPMFPSMLAVFHSVVRPKGFFENIEPSRRNADYLRLLLFRLVNLMCSRGLRASDPLLGREKKLSRQERLGSPQFGDIRIENDSLQIILKFPNTIILNRYSVGANFEFLWGLVFIHKDTTISLDLRWLKNRKESNFLAKLSFSRSPCKDMCIVNHFLLVLNHRYKFYRSFSWDFFFSLPKIATQEFLDLDGFVVKKGDPCFVPFTKPRYNEVWSELIRKTDLYTKFTPHDLRRGVQRVLRRARTYSVINISPDVCSEYGLWKRPRSSQ